MIPDKIYIPIIEEDGKKLLCTNWWLTDARSRYVNETIPYIRKDSLWKPSEEQMEALEYVIRDYIEDGCNATANYLQEILGQIKKL